MRNFLYKIAFGGIFETPMRGCIRRNQGELNRDVFIMTAISTPVLRKDTSPDGLSAETVPLLPGRISLNLCLPLTVYKDDPSHESEAQQQSHLPV